jgi:hypothetical protein
MPEKAPLSPGKQQLPEPPKPKRTRNLQLR